MSEEAPAIVGIAALAIDCTDPLGLARWWSRVLGGSIDIDPQGGLGQMKQDTCGKKFLPTLHPAFKANIIRAKALKSSKESCCGTMAIRLV